MTTASALNSAITTGDHRHVAPHHPQVSWSDADIKLALAMWNDGHTASQIAPMLSEKYTRNAVCGKLDRLDAPKRGKIFSDKVQWSTRGNPKKRETGRTHPIRREKLKRTLTRRAPTLVIDDPVLDIGLTLMALKHDSCRWPVARFDGQQRFCGCTQTHQSYCASHHEQSVEPE